MPDRSTPSDRLPPLTPDALRDAALRHIARFATTEIGLVRVLDRRIARWARRTRDMDANADPTAAATAARLQARSIAADLVAQGLIDDAAFAAARSRRMSRVGRSARAIGAALAKAGVDPALAVRPPAGDAGMEGELELDRAILAARRKRLGPFARPSPGHTDADLDHDDPDGHTPDGDNPNHRALGQLARAGFSRLIAERVLEMSPDEAEARALAIRQRD